MDLSIIIVTYNSLEPVERCIASIETHEPRCAYEIIVVDNSSIDGTAAAVARRFPRVRVVANAENLGYSRGVNQGIRLSIGRAILILNPDIIAREGSIDRLMEFLDAHPDAGIVGSKLVYPDGRLQHSCRSFYTLGALVLRRTFLGALFPRAKPLRDHLLLDYDHETPRTVDWIIGACMLVRREALEKVGAMDERFFLYFEDIDWCNRMKRHGWSVYYAPSSVMTHTYERSSARSVLRKPFLIHMLSLMRYYEKWNRFFYAVRRNRGAIKASVFAVSDLAALNLSFLAAYYLRNLLQPLFELGLYPIGWYGPFILFYNLVFFIALVAGGLYRVRRETPFSEEFMRLVRAVFLGLVVLMAATYISRVRIYSRAVVLGQAGIAVFALALFRRVIRELHRELVKARFDLKRVLDIGSKEEAVELTERLAGAPELGIDVVGYVGAGAGALGTSEDLPDLLERFKIQEVIICQSRQNDRALLPFLAHSRRRVIQIRMISPLARFLGQGVRVEEFAGLAVFSLERRILFEFERGIKRICDCVAGAVALPFVECAFLAYRLYGRMKGTVTFFGEGRRGRRGRSFVWPRALRASGREAGDFAKPALCLALIGGTLSLVGPPSLYEGQANEFAGALLRVRPGITGRWRLSRRGSRRQALEEEALGLESWSLERDIMTFMESIGALCSGAYPRWFFSKGDAA
ncbi:MAG: glycosyltransferase [Candidatus Krumholzibacteria bacterium]|nr:glycosyltransferase [Candidatus Krumholzibacteria bacterium]